MKKSQLFLCLLWITASCTFVDNPKITIVNESDMIFNEVFIYTSASSNEPKALGELKKGETLKSEYVFNNNTTGDGAYCLELIDENGIKIKERFGYYTNGSSLNRAFEVKIYNDTTLIKEW